LRAPFCTIIPNPRDVFQGFTHHVVDDDDHGPDGGTRHVQQTSRDAKERCEHASYRIILGSRDGEMTLTSELGKSAGKQWHPVKQAFRPNAGLTTYAKRAKLRADMTIMKAKEKEMKEEKEAERQVCAFFFLSSRYRYRHAIPLIEALQLARLQQLYLGTAPHIQ
jgi:hypothetical protein